MSEEVTITLTTEEAKILSELVTTAWEDASNDDDAHELSIINTKLGYAPLMDDDDEEE